jgi:hypothetical protein
MVCEKEDVYFLVFVYLGISKGPGTAVHQGVGVGLHPSALHTQEHALQQGGVALDQLPSVHDRVTVHRDLGHVLTPLLKRKSREKGPLSAFTLKNKK